MTRTRRLGCFIVLIGVVLLGLFLASDQAQAPEFNYLVAGIGLALLGIWLWSIGKPPPRNSSRFRILRRRDNDGDDQE